MITDFAKWDTPSQLHMIQVALSMFKDKYSRFPELKNDTEAERMIQFVKDIDERHRTSWVDKGEEALTLDHVDEELIKKVALYSSVEVPGFPAFLGGVVAQEIVKHTGKYTPLRQWLHFECSYLVDDQVIIRNLKADDLGFKYDSETGKVTEIDEKESGATGIQADMHIVSINDEILPPTEKKAVFEKLLGNPSSSEIKVQFRRARDDRLDDL